MTDLSQIEIDPKTFLKKDLTLSPLPVVVTRLQELMSAEDVSIKKVAHLLSGDPPLAAQILKVANSAYYTFHKEIVDINFAVAYMGINEVNRIALPYAVIKCFDIENMTSFNAIWKHSIYTALCVRYLAKKYEPLLSPGELWSAALLHDIGKFLYMKFFPDHYNALEKCCREKKYLFSQAENHFSLPTSTYLGSLLCDHWGLPEKIKNVCRFHRIEDLEKRNKEDQYYAFSWIVTLGNLTAILAIDPLSDKWKNKIVKILRKNLNCSEADFLVLMGDIYEMGYEVENFI